MPVENYSWRLNPTFVDILMKCIKAGVTPALYGKAGIGKSCALEDLATKLGTKCFTVNCNQLAGREDVTQPRLVKMQNNNNVDDFKAIFVVIDTIKEAAEYAAKNPRETPILFLDEYNRVPAELTTGLMSLITARKAGSVQFPPNLRIVIAGNSVGNVASDDDAVVTRLINFYVQPDVTTFLNAPSIKANLNESVKKVILAHNEMLLAEPADDTDADYGDEASQAKQYACPRTLEYLSKILNVCTPDELDDWEGKGVLLPLIQACVGVTPTADAIHQQLKDDIAQKVVTSNVTTIVKPAVYDEIKKLTTISEIEQKLNSLTTKERGAVLAYALFEKEDNTAIVTAYGSVPFNWLDADVKDIVSNMFAAAQNGTQPDIENLKLYLSRTGDTYLGLLQNLAGI